MASYQRLTNSSLTDKNKYQKCLTLVLMVFGIFLGIYFDELFKLSTESFSYLKHEHFKSHNFDLNHLPLVSHAHQNENNSLAQILQDATPILCFVMLVNYNYHQNHVVAIQRTWGSRCSKLLIFGDEEVENLGVIKLQIPSEYFHLEWSAIKEAFKYIYDNNYTNYDWYAKVDIKSYVIMENLRYLLYPYSSEQPYYFGNRLKGDNMHGYMSSNPGYVLSKEAVRRFVDIGYSNSTLCGTFILNTDEDLLMGNCLENLNVIFGDSRDNHQQLRFLEYPLHEYFQKSNTNLWKNNFYDTSNDSMACSDYLISFPNKNKDPRYNYLLDFYVYHLRLYGISPIMDELPIKLSYTKIEEAIAIKN